MEIYFKEIVTIMAKKKYSPVEKRAYYQAQGFAACMAGKRIECKSEATKASFKAGLKKMQGKTANMPDRKGGNK